ncbi:hypothetical protein CsSME_00023310 [Camellia sinensis var. sinensis]
MSLLDQLWDDTVAGPRPESGLGRLRKQPSFTFRPVFGKESDGGSTEEVMKVTRRIMIVKPPPVQGTNQNGSPPVSPAGSTPPVSPFAGKKFRRRSMSDAYEKTNNGIGGHRSPRPPCDL